MTFGVKTNERPGTRATLKYGRFSAYKAREVLNLIRNKPVGEARDILAFTERGSAEPIMKLLDSAVANAENNDGIAASELYVSACFADEGPTLKRFRPRARGRASAIRKRTCHITIIVSRYSNEDLEVMRERLARSAGSTASARDARARRVARSRQRSGDTDEVLESDEELETSEATETGVDDVVENASDAVESDGPFGAGSAAPLEDGSAPEGFEIKGNADSMLYHEPGGPFYERTVAEVWFDTVESAERAGFAAPKSVSKVDEDADADADNPQDATTEQGEG